MPLANQTETKINKTGYNKLGSICTEKEMTRLKRNLWSGWQSNSTMSRVLVLHVAFLPLILGTLCGPTLSTARSDVRAQSQE